MIFLVFLVTITPIMGVILLPVLLLGKSTIRATIKIWAHLMLGGLKLICGISHRIEGIENIPEGGALIASNHQSMWETIALFTVLERPVMIFKRDFLKNPIYRWWGLATGGIPVDRDGGAMALRRMAREAAARIAEGEQIIVFREGTRAAIDAPIKLQPGVAGIYKAANKPCVPAVHNSGWYWRHPGGLKLPGEIILSFLPTIEPGMRSKTFIAELKTRLQENRPSPASIIPTQNSAPQEMAAE